jgi:plastocyanin
MTWRSDICFKSALLLAVTALCGSLLGANISGQIRLINSSDATVNKHANFSSVVIWLERPGVEFIPATRMRVQMVQDHKKFTPHILVVSTGTVVDFPNLDPIFHNAFSNFDGEIFDIGLYPPGSSRSQRFDRTGIVRVFCNIHPSMSAIILVINSRYFTKTGDDGRFSLTDVRPGTYQIHFFHERATPETLERLTRSITVTDESLALPPITISEAGYLPAAHKNKYGRDYPAHADDQQTYSLPMK